MQLTYNVNPRGSKPGMLNTLAPRFIRTAINKEGAAIPYGVALAKKTGGADDEYDLPDAAADKIVGIAAFEHNERIPETGSTNGVAEIGDGLPFSLVVQGCVSVLVEEAVTQGDAVYVRHTATETNTQLGAFRKSADTATAALVRGARFLTSAAEGGVAIVQIDALANAGLADLDAEVRQDNVEPATDHIQVTATTTVKFFKAPAAMIVDSVEYINPTGLAEHADNYYDIAVKNGATVVANKNTKVGEGGTLAADTFTALTNGTLANRTLAAGDVLALVLTKAGTQTLPAGKVVVHGHYV